MVFAAVTVTAGCTALSPGVSVIVEIPPLPAFLADRFIPTGIRLSFPAADGSVATQTLTAEFPVAERLRISLGVRRARVVPIVARFLISGFSPERLQCGAFFPDDLRSGLIRLTWEDGCLAGFFLRYLSAGNNGEWFNLEKVRTAAGDATGGNPWNLDLDILAAGVSAYALSYSIVREAKTKEAFGALPAGIWFRADPLAPVPLMIESAECAVPVTLGFHCFFEARTGAVAELYAGGEFWISIVNRDPESVVSGRW